jgi:MerR family copper efflux transcriptional regulator
MNRLTIGRLAAAADVGIDTVRFYERAGLMPKPQRTGSGYRSYGPDDVSRLQFIRRAKTLGFALDEIAELLRLSRGQGGREGVKALAQRRLRNLDERIAEFTRMRDVLAAYERRCSGTGAVAGCPIIEAVVAHPSSPPSEAPRCHPLRKKSPAARLPRTRK